MSVEQRTPYGLAYFKHIQEAREEEIDGSEGPKHQNLLAAIAQRGSHSLYADVCIDTPGGGEDGTHGFPKRRYRCTRSTDTCKEQQRYGHEDEKQDAVLTAIDKTGPEDGHEGAG